MTCRLQSITRFHLVSQSIPNTTSTLLSSFVIVNLIWELASPIVQVVNCVCYVTFIFVPSANSKCNNASSHFNSQSATISGAIYCQMRVESLNCTHKLLSTCVLNVLSLRAEYNHCKQGGSRIVPQNTRGGKAQNHCTHIERDAKRSLGHTQKKGVTTFWIGE